MDQAETLRNMMDQAPQGIRLSCHLLGSDAESFPIEALHQRISGVQWLSSPESADGHFVVLSRETQESLLFETHRPIYVAVNGVTSAEEARKVYKNWIEDFLPEVQANIIYLGHLERTSFRGQDFPRSSKLKFLIPWKTESKEEEALQLIAKRLNSATEGQIWA